jgi:carbon monoxide dehydrogenase subunit G
MVIEGRYEIDGIPRERVFEALSDPAILARAVPGCKELVDRGDGVYDLTISAGVGAVRGTYAGQVKIGERRAPDLYEAVLEASGGPGSVQATMRAELASHNGGTAVSYSMDATLAGAIAGVGQRVLSGASRKNATMFLDGLQAVLNDPASASTAADAEPQVASAAAASAVNGSASGATPAPRVYGGGAAASGGDGDVQSFTRGVVLGFLLAAASFITAGVLENRRARR